jgi:outer membrane immunogenic protein
MKRLFTAGFGLIVLAAAMPPALAADLPVEPYAKAPVVYIDPWSWNSVYVGLNGGYSFGRSITDPMFSRNSFFIFPSLLRVNNGFDVSGGLFGGQIGVNWQAGRFVFGFETDVQWTDQNGSSGVICATGICSPAAPVVESLTRRLNWFGTARARVGVTPIRPVLVYVTAGAAYGGVKSDVLVTGTTAGLPVAAALSDSVARVGWTVGAGVEARLGDRWTGKIEYLYVDIERTGIAALVTPIAATGGGVVATSFDSRFTDSIFRVGINYQLNPFANARHY